jgi:hypothetical protein
MNKYMEVTYMFNILTKIYKKMQRMITKNPLVIF